MAGWCWESRDGETTSCLWSSYHLCLVKSSMVAFNYRTVVRRQLRQNWGYGEKLKPMIEKIPKNILPKKIKRYLAYDPTEYPCFCLWNFASAADGPTSSWSFRSRLTAHIIMRFRTRRDHQQLINRFLYRTNLNKIVAILENSRVIVTNRSQSQKHIYE